MSDTAAPPALPGMLCPHCKVDLVMADRQGIEIDYCPKCRGVWLDRGELDKIIERNAQFYAAPAQDAPPPAPSKPSPPAATPFLPPGQAASGYAPPPPVWGQDPGHGGGHGGHGGGHDGHGGGHGGGRGGHGGGHGGSFLGRLFG